MATWKKVVVSGSAVTQLDFTDSTVLSGSISNILPSGVVSSSAQTIANLPAGTVSGSAQTIANLPAGVVSGSAQTIANLPSGVVSGSTQTIANLVGSTILSGSISNLLPSGVVSSSAQTVANLPAGTVSGSSQVSFTSISDVPTGIVSSSAQTIANLPSGVVSGSAQTIANLPSGVVSGSTQTIANLVGSTILSGSISNLLPSGVVSSSAQTIANLPSGTVSSSIQVSFTGISDVPTGIVSSSAQTIANLPSGVVSGSAQTIANLVGSTILSGSLPDDFIQSVGNTTGQTGITLGVDGNGDLTATAANLDTTNDVEFANLTVSGDLEVAGTASFKHSSNLNVADQYISMNSGSTGAGLDSGGIVVLQDGASGELFGWADGSGDQRWGVLTNFNPGSTGDFSPTAYMSAVLKPAAANTEAAILTAGGGTAGAGYNKEGNLYTSTADDSIWIYS